MTQSQNSQDQTFDVHHVGRTWYVREQNGQVWGQGDTLEAAKTHFDQEWQKHQDISAAVGAEVLSTTGFGYGLKAMLNKTWGVVKILMIVGLCAIPVSYAISYGVTTGIKRGLNDAEIRGGRAFWSKVEKSILELGSEEHRIDPEREKEIHKALNNIVDRLSPFTQQLGYLFIPGAKRPNAQDGGQTEAVNGTAHE